MPSVFTGKVLSTKVPLRSFYVLSFHRNRWLDLVNRTKASAHVNEITAPELHDDLRAAERPMLIDVRESAEWSQTGKLPGAICIPRGVLELAIENATPPEVDSEIVLYCAGGHRSIMAAETLLRMGYDKDNIKSLKGGFASWLKEGYTVEKATE